MKIWNLEFKNNIILASGPWGFGEGYGKLINFQLFSAITFKSITLKPKKGNEHPRLLPLEYGMLNSIGLQNPGVNVFKEEVLPNFKDYNTIRICSVAGHDEDEFLKIVQILKDEKLIDVFELNLSCPNVGGELFCFNKDAVRYIVENAKKITKKPIVVKFSTEGNILPFVEVALNSGADGLNIGNSPTGIAIDIERRKPFFKRVVAGYSGKAIKPIVLKQVYNVYKHFKPIIIGLGGIYDYKDALEYMMAGATFISIGSAIYKDPNIPEMILKDLKIWMENHGVKSLTEIIGSAL